MKKIITFAGRKVIITKLTKVLHNELLASVEFRNRLMDLRQSFKTEEERDSKYNELWKSFN